jgi:hypothetical protein
VEHNKGGGPKWCFFYFLLVKKSGAFKKIKRMRNSMILRTNYDNEPIWCSNIDIPQIHAVYILAVEASALASVIMDQIQPICQKIRKLGNPAVELAFDVFLADPERILLVLDNFIDELKNMHIRVFGWIKNGKKRLEKLTKDIFF